HDALPIFPGRRAIEQRFVRNTAPEKERQARRELEIRDGAQRAGRERRRIALETKDELRRCEHALERCLDAAFESAPLAPCGVELEQRVEIALRLLAAISE